jgi:hypothetical protein
MGDLVATGIITTEEQGQLLRSILLVGGPARFFGFPPILHHFMAIGLIERKLWLERDGDEWWDVTLSEKGAALAQTIPAPLCTEDRLRNLLRRAHDAMSRREPDGISTAAWDQLLQDIAKEIGLG